MRIALACPYAWEDAGGVQVHVGELARRLLDRGHDVLVLAPARRPPPEPWVRAAGRPVNIPYNASNAPIDPRPWSRSHVRGLLADFGPDVLHVHEPLTPSTSLWATLEAGSVPVVATFHSAASRSLLFDAAAPVLRRIARRLSIRIAVSEAAAGFARSRLGGSFEVVPNGVDVARFREAGGADMGAGTKLLFVGRLDERKGFTTAVEAFSRLAASREDLRLIVVGDGPDRRAIESLSPEEREKVTLLGRVDHGDVPQYYAACQLYLGPAVGGESFGIVLVEAMAAGLPVVASDIAGYREVVRDGVQALLVRPRDPAALAAAVEKVLEDEALRDRLVAAGRERARGFDWQVVTSRIEEIYGLAVASGPP